MADIVDPFDSGIVDPFASGDREPKPRIKGTMTVEDLKSLRPGWRDRVGAMGRAATREILPTASGTAGAVVGAELGLLGGPAAPVTVPLGALAGGVLGGLAGQQAQRGALSAVPGVARALGQTPEQVRRDTSQFPVSTGVASFAPALAGGTALQRALSPKGSASAGLMETPRPPTRDDLFRETRLAAERQGVRLPSTLTSPTGYQASRLMPNIVGTGVLDRAEAKAPQTIGEALADLSRTVGRVSERGAAGERAQASSAAGLEALRKSGGEKIEEANKLAQGIKLAPTETVKYIDETVAELERNPIANGPFIKWLSGVKGDLMNPDNPLDVASLRDLRHTLYRQTSPEGIAAKDRARLAGSLWTSLSNDIRNGLIDAEGAGIANARKALDAFDAGSADWSKRQNLYNKALNKVLGSDFAEDLSDPANPVFVAQKTPEAAFDTIRNMTVNDRRAFQKTLSAMDDESKETVRASIIASLGRNDTGEFVPSKFLSEMHQMPVQTRIALFGRENVEAMDDLQTIARNIGQVEPRSGGWGQYAAPGAVLGMLGLSGAGTLAATGVAGGFALNSGAAHILAKPDSLKWLAKLASSSQKGVDAFNATKEALGEAASSKASLWPLYNLVSREGAPEAEVPEGGSATEAVDPSQMSDEELDAFLGLGAEGPAADVEVDDAEMASFTPDGLSEMSFEQLVPAVVQAESGGNPEAVSPKGAEGRMQVMPATQTDPGFGVEPAADRSHGEKERVGVEYLKAMVERYPSQALALMAYNWGPGNVDRWVEGGMKGPVPKETRDYVRKILGAS